MKTLKDEIVEWLRQAGEFDLRYTAQPDGSPSLLGIEGKKIWEERAAKVESARCKNCDHYVSAEDDEGCDMVMLEFQGPGFGCWNFEPKEK